MATIVPIVSKKSASMIENTSRTTATTPIFSTEPNSENWPSSEKSGAATRLSGSAGTSRLQPFGLSSLRPPIPTTASSTTASRVAATIEMRIAPRTPRVMRTIMSSRPTTNTTIGQPASEPPEPSCSGVPCARA